MTSFCDIVGFTLIPGVADPVQYRGGGRAEIAKSAVSCRNTLYVTGIAAICGLIELYKGNRSNWIWAITIGGGCFASISVFGLFQVALCLKEINIYGSDSA